MARQPEVAINRIMSDLEPYLAQAIVQVGGASGIVAKSVENDLRLALPVCGIATELSKLALSQIVKVPVERLERPLSPRLGISSKHLIVRCGTTIVDPTLLSFTDLVSLRPQEAQANQALRELYPVNKIGVFKVDDARGVGVQFADYLYRIEPKVRAGLGHSGILDYLDRPSNGILFGQRNKRLYSQVVEGLWNIQRYEPVMESAHDAERKKRIDSAVEMILDGYHGATHAA